MLKRASLVLVVFFMAVAAWGWDTKKPLDPKELEGKSVEELYLMRNEIYARHGKPFKTFELDQYFGGQAWYKLDLDYKDDRLEETEKHNAALILEKEKKLLTDNLLSIGGSSRLNLSNIYNRRQFGAFSKGDQDKLAKNGFLMVPAKHEQFFHLYENNSYLGVGSFITTDAVLQLYHVFFDFTLRNIEQEKLLPILEDLTRQMLARSKTLAGKSTDPRMKEAAIRNLALFSVGQALLTGGTVQADKAVAQIVKAEVAKIKAHAGREECSLYPPEHCLDYSQFVPRGHYTRSEALSRYFLAMMWYGSCAFVADQERELDAALVMTLLLNQSGEGQTPLAPLWVRLYEPTVFFAGLSDDVGPDDLWPEIQKIYGLSPAPNVLFKPESQVRLREAVQRIAREKTRIITAMVCIPSGPQFRFMGQRYIPDSEVLQRLSSYPERAFPKGLDMAAVLGSGKARSIVLDENQEAKAWPHYPAELDKLLKEFGAKGSAEWKQNLYWGWLWCLKALYEPPKGKIVPFFATTDGWARKGVNTSLGSWAELRHDTILYGKQSGAECGGGEDWNPDPPKGFVEPNAEFFGRLQELLALTHDGLQRRDLLTPRLKEKLERFTDLAVFLKRMADKELAGVALTPEENGRIQIFGTDLENLTISVITDDSLSGWYEITSDTDKHIAVVADVHTSMDSVLEEAVGPAFEIYVVVEIDGYLKLLRGAVFSYYEFPWPASDRLTDEAWQKLLKEAKAPPQPGWTKPIMSDQPSHEVPKPKYNGVSTYSSGC